jgi:translation initiation factor IF-3
MRVIGSSGENLGVLTKQEALSKAKEEGLDLVLISPKQETPVAKIVDWSKFKYVQKKKQKKQGKSVEVKEWWFKPNIEPHDINNKLNNIEKYLKKGGKVKVTIKYKRKALYSDMQDTMNKVMEMSSEFSEPVSEINKEGRNLSVFLKYKKNEKK